MDALISPLPSNSFPIWFQFSWITNVVFFCGGIIVNLVEVRWQLHSPPDPLLFWSITSDKGGGGGFPRIAWKGLQLKRQGDISNAFDMLSYHCHPFITPNQILLILTYLRPKKGRSDLNILIWTFMRKNVLNRNQSNIFSMIRINAVEGLLWFLSYQYLSRLHLSWKSASRAALSENPFMFF